MKRTGIHGAGFVSIGDMANGAVGGAESPWWDPNNEGLCVWSAYQPKGAANLAASYIDLSGNGNNTGPGTAPTWDAVNGWIFNGSNQYLTTTFVPQDDQSQSFLVQFTNSINTSDYICGSTDTSNVYFTVRLASAEVNYWNGSSSGSTAPQMTAAGNLAVAGNQGYRNGVVDGGPIGLAVLPACAFYIGCRNNNGAAANFHQAYIQALALYDCTLSSAQVLAVATAMSSL